MAGSIAFRGTFGRAAGSTRLGGLLHAPELETLIGDRLFDRAPRQIVWRGAVGTNDSGRLPRAVLGGQLAAGGIAGECAQIGASLRFEHEDVHHANILSARRTRLRVGWPAPLRRRLGLQRLPLGPRNYLR